jgi:uncharacterized protein
MLQILFAGLVLGTISSFHCVGMCGPLALALPIQHLTGWQRALSLFLYHVGRISVYAGFGLVFGLAGRGLYLAGFQQWFSVGLGVLMLFFLGQYVVFRNFRQPALISRFNRRIQGWVMQIWKTPSKSGLVWLGMANGLLPCGMVYLAIAGALSASQVKFSVLFMVMFGLGTLPALFAISFFGSLIKLSIRNKIRQWTPFLVAFMAIVLILRGLNLGIPFISPLLGGPRAPAIICH